jgi:hypothetical protein
MVQHLVVGYGLYISLGFIGAHSVKRNSEDLALTDCELTLAIQALAQAAHAV